jgi:hypothetical protein
MRVLKGGHLKHKGKLFLFVEIIKPVWDNFQKNVSAGLNDGDVADNEINDAKAFVNYSLTEDDKTPIAKEVKIGFDWEAYELAHPECDVEFSDVVEGAIERWVKAKFNFWLSGWGSCTSDFALINRRFGNEI